MPHDPDDTQPFGDGRIHPRRFYIPAVWKPAGGGSHAPKISGGYEVDIHGNPIATRGLNRIDQRYQQAIATLDANRTARANSEIASTVILRGAMGMIECRSIAGNNYDVAPNGTYCDCPDRLKLGLSYPAQFVQCKHIRMVMSTIQSVGLTNMDWAVSKYAEYTGIAERTVEQLCQDGLIPATKVHKVWVIAHGTAGSTASAYRAKVAGPRVVTVTMSMTVNSIIGTTLTVTWKTKLTGTEPIYNLQPNPANVLYYVGPGLTNPVGASTADYSQMPYELGVGSFFNTKLTFNTFGQGHGANHTLKFGFNADPLNALRTQTVLWFYP